MALILRKREEETERFEILFDPKRQNSPPRKDLDPDQLETAVFQLRPQRGTEVMKIGDALVEANKQGTTSVKSGTVVRERVVRGVASVEGVEDEEGRPITRMTIETFPLFPAWMIYRINKAILERNEETAVEGE